MKKYLLALATLPLLVFAADAVVAEPNVWQQIFAYLAGLAPWVSYVLITLGSLVVMGIGLDAVIPDEKDKGFMKKVLSIPILGDLLKALSYFSPFNNKDKDNPQA